MTGLYPDIEPHDSGMLEVGDGNLVYWEACGNPAGKAAVVLHGGPGAGCTTRHRRLFDPERYRIVLLDQRGCGRSLPHAADIATDLATNTTPHLVADLEALRSHLGVDRWLVHGASWGSTLALAYAQAHPACVTEIVLAAVTMTRPGEIAWLYHGAGRFFPEAWERFRAGAGDLAGDGDLVTAYHRLLADPDPTVRVAAAEDWCAWEDAVLGEPAPARPHPPWDDPRFRMAFARLVTHYFHHRAWLDDGQLLRHAGRLSAIPGRLVHGRLDISAPLVTAWELARAWPGCELTVLDAGHALTGPGMSETVVAATDRFADPPPTAPNASNSSRPTP
ncbi:MAG: prolyl aminopeptidase [Acidimicrobiales bacterium]